MHVTVPSSSLAETDTTSIQMREDASPTLPPPLPPVSSTMKTAPGPTTPAPTAPTGLPSHETSMKPFELQRQTEPQLDFSSHLRVADIDVFFDKWETESVKAMVLAKLGAPYEEFAASLGETQLETSSEVEIEQPSRINKMINDWLEDISDQPQVLIDTPWDEYAIHQWDE
jgi:hypothetical protein